MSDATLNETIHALHVSETENRVLREKLREIAEYHPEPDPEIAEELQEARDLRAACPECQEPRRRAWPPELTCNDHYCMIDRLERRMQAHMDYRRWAEPKRIARAALGDSE